MSCLRAVILQSPEYLGTAMVEAPGDLMKKTRQHSWVLSYKYQVSLRSDSIRAVNTDDFPYYLPRLDPGPSTAVVGDTGRQSSRQTSSWHRHEPGKTEPCCLHAAKVSLPETGEGLQSFHAHGLCSSCLCLSWFRLKHSPYLLKF